MGQRCDNKKGDEKVATYFIQELQFDVYGCREDTDQPFEHYWVFEGDECINEGDPYNYLPSYDDIEEWLEGGAHA